MENFVEGKEYILDINFNRLQGFTYNAQSVDTKDEWMIVLRGVVKIRWNKGSNFLQFSFIIGNLATII